MGQTLTNGIYLPAEGEVRCYAGLASNWTTLDAVVGGYRAHVANENIHITSAERSKWNNGVTQAYVLRYASVSLTALGTVAFSALDNTDNIKIGDKVLDSEGKLFALTAVDTANTSATLSALLIDLSKDSDLSNYYTKGETDTLLSSKANDSGVVHTAGAETIPGEKTFTKYITSDGSSTGDEYSGNSKTNLWLMGNRDTEEVSGVLFDTFRQNTEQGTGTHILGMGIKENAVRYEGCRFSWIWDKNLNGYSFSIRPTLQGTNQAVEHCLGLSTDKWDKINGINPGALSMPNLSAGVDISSYVTDLAGGINNFTPTVDGYISICTTSSGANASFIKQGDFGASSRDVTISGTRYGYVCLPVVKNVAVDMVVISTSIGFAKFYPCQGNV